MYLQHRKSVDLDFFSLINFDTQAVLNILNTWSKKYNFEVQAEYFEPTYICTLIFSDKEKLKLDFSYHPYKKLAPPVKYGNHILVDSLIDIAVNKLLAISQRIEAKDFVDLYYLLHKYTVWDLMEGVRVKYRITTEPYILSSDLYLAEGLELMPKMVKPLALDELKAFFRQKAKELAKTAVE